MEWKFGVTAASDEVGQVGSTFLHLKLVVDKGFSAQATVGESESAGGGSAGKARVLEDVYMELTLPQVTRCTTAESKATPDDRTEISISHSNLPSLLFSSTTSWLTWRKRRRMSISSRLSTCFFQGFGALLMNCSDELSRNAEKSFLGMTLVLKPLCQRWRAPAHSYLLLSPISVLKKLKMEHAKTISCKQFCITNHCTHKSKS
jgi:hypothetical protein